MKFWADFLSDKTALSAIYGDDVPELWKVNLHELMLHRDGPTASFRLDLASFPKAPPKKWSASGFNCVQLKILAIGVRDLSIAGWCIENQCDISVFSKGESLGIKIDEEGLNVSLKADHLVLDGISAYRMTTRP